MEHNQRLELIDLAIQKRIKENRINKGTDYDHDAEYQLALSHLFSVSQLESFKGDDVLEQYEVCTPSEPVSSVIQKTESEDVDGGKVDEGYKGNETSDEIVKELKKVKRQNFVTHCLLSVMIVLTLTWQLSEVSLIMKVKDRINHPFRSFGSMLKGMMKVPDRNGQEVDKEEDQTDSSFLKIPEMPHVDVPNLGLNKENQ